MRTTTASPEFEKASAGAIMADIKTSRADFEAVFPDLVQDLSEYSKQYGIPAQALTWFQKVWAPILAWAAVADLLSHSTRTHQVAN